MADIPPEQVVIDEPLSRALGERYLQYALSTITHRALPDVRDGLKPVHRRLLYAMRALRLGADSPFKKSARVVGDVIGKFHPHGEQAVYDALVRLAQDFSSRYPLIDGQGNFGNVDGDNAAAQRYTEARLTAVSAALMEGLDEQTVDFRPTYDGSEQEPEVLPAALPNLLANGSSGIAVGMATNIPPHNLGELCDALLALLADPQTDDAAINALVPAPDFPGGGVIVEPAEAIAEAYRTGRGGFRLRASWRREDLGRGQYQIVIDEIPYLVQKSKLYARIADLITSKKVPILADVRDESAEDIRLVLEPRTRSVDADALMETLFRLTDLETRFSLNMNVLNAQRVPGVMSLRAVLLAYLDHRRDVLLRRSAYRLERIAARLSVLEAFIVAYLNLDRVIEIIRAEDEPKPVLMHEFQLLEDQAEAILNMRLRSLRKLEELELRRERDALLEERAGLETLVDDPAAQTARLTEEIGALQARFGAPEGYRGLREAEAIIALRRRDGAAYPPGARRTGLSDAPAVTALTAEAMIEREPITVILSEQAFIRAMKGHVPLDSEIKYKAGDGPRFILHAETTDRLLALSAAGRVFTIAGDKLPGGRSMGEPLRLSHDLAQDDAIIALIVHRPGARRILASDDGRGFVVAEDAMVAQTRAGRQVITPGGGAALSVCAAVAGDHVAVAGENRKMLVFALEELPELARGKGVILQRYKDGGLADLKTFTLADGLTWRDPAGRTRTVTDLDEWLGKRGGAGRMAPRGFPRDNRFT